MLPGGNQLPPISAPCNLSKKRRGSSLLNIPPPPKTRYSSSTNTRPPKDEDNTDKVPGISDTNEENDSSVALDNFHRHNRKWELRTHFVSVVFELFDLLYGLGMFILFATGVSQVRDDYQSSLYKLYLAVTISGTISGSHMAYTRIQSIRHVLRELREGVKTSKSVTRGLMGPSHQFQSTKGSFHINSQSTGVKVNPDPSPQLHVAAKESTKRGQSNSQSASNISVHSKRELIVAQAKRRKRLFKSNITAGVLEDLPVMLLIIYRIFFSDELLNDSFRLCLAQNESILWQCGTTTHQFVILQLLLSVSMATFRFSYIRDLWRTNHLIQEHVNELIQAATLGASILDDFKKGEVSEDEVNVVVAVRQLLGDTIKGLPDDVAGDFKLLGFVRASKGQVFDAVNRFRKYLEWRGENNVDEIREDILRNDLCVNHLPGWEQMQKCVQHNFFLGFNEAYDGAIISVSHVGKNMNDKAIIELGLHKFSKYFICFNEWQSIVCTRKSLATGTCIRQRQIIDGKGSGTEGLNVYKYFSHVMQNTTQMYPELGYAGHIANLTLLGAKSLELMKSLMSDDMELYGTSVGDKGIIELLQVIDTNIVPKALGGSATTDNGNDPDCFKGRPKRPISQIIGRFIELDLFSDVSPEESINVKKMQDQLEYREPRYKSYQGGDDDLMGCVQLLRFLRDQDGNVEDAITAFQKCLDTREELGMGPVRATIFEPNWSVHDIPAFQQVTQVMALSLFPTRTMKGDLIWLLRFGDVDFVNLKVNLSIEQYRESIGMYFNEYQNIILDRLSRLDRKLIKVETVADVRGVGSSSSIITAYVNSIEKVNESIHPQNNRAVTLFGANKLVVTLWRAARPLLPQKFAESIKLLSATDESSHQLCELLGADAVPVSMGGRARTQGGRNDACYGPQICPRLGDDLRTFKWATER